VGRINNKIMTKCIYCSKEKANSKEHYLPACLGSFRNFEQLSGKLCSSCNGRISKLEEQFCRCGPETFFRIVKKELRSENIMKSLHRFIEVVQVAGTSVEQVYDVLFGKRLEKGAFFFD
jgi:hypothetical protein